LTARIFLKLVAGVVGLLVVALLTADYFATKVVNDSYLQNLTGELANKCRMIALPALAPEQLDAAHARRIAEAAGGRLTVVRSDGKVLVDSEADAATMENHRLRPELIQAFQGRVGSAQRSSATTGEPFLYVAVPISGKAAAVRLAVPLSRIHQQVSQIRNRMMVSIALAFMPAILIALVLARYLSHRFGTLMAHAGELARGNFRSRVPVTGSSEFGELSRTLNDTAQNLQRTVSQLQREHSELEKLERIRKDFVINVSHELRTPLASIQGYTETLMDGALDDPDHNMRFLGIIRHNAERLARLTEDLLTLSRIEQKCQKFEFAHHRVNRMMEDAIQLVYPIAAKNNLALVEEPAPESATAWCDAEAVSQILSNLMENAVKYTPAGGRISVGARQLDGMIEIYVRDTGIGIPEEDLPRLFERFYRVDKARSRELGGTGLGLSIVKHLVAAHHGSTRVESRVNEGSTFYFTLPVDEASLGAEQLNPEFTAS